ncbi:alpha/beta hydrolase-fold protein [Massilia aurea]|uniref:alpha/beta hydrolase n=1 Tax=Massilia aurea TaxID=373040 RepID=UPI0034630E27
MTTAVPTSLPRRRILGAAAALTALGAPLARAADGWQPAMLQQARQLDIASPITGQTYRIFISIPASAPLPGGHPVVYALDGNASFATLALLARTTIRRNPDTGMAPPVVVGIGYPGEHDYALARGRDYTPPAGKDGPAKEGGADLFLDFIEKELKPLIAKLAPIDPARQALYGHSYGGLCTLHALFTRPAMFQTYLAASPSIWYHKRLVLGGMDGFSRRVAAQPAKPSLMLSVGELEQPAAASGPLEGRQAIAAARRMVDEARELGERLQQANTLSRVQFHLLAHENHMSASFPAMARGLEFFLA